ncbi:uncharacterized protein [Nicotiana sylvestris]|uniref:GRF-type domain-containing protein n=2 Tax=Nicotiana TaxID=4085 RepID=A0A1S4ANB7_TOBAC|nr:PREDICTED: uncharacterized protein LOC104218174 [Nicotiana sylvestris]XP_016478217.1 PREDICTED: uncharacterized protein LOC107799594 [Nicotiana tabacum]
MSESSCSSKRRCFCGDIANNFTSTTVYNPGRRFYKCAKPENESCGFWEWQDEVLLDRALVVINNFKSKFDVAQVQLITLNKALDACKIERERLMQKVDALEAINIVEANKARELEEKVLKLKMFIIISCALFVGFVTAFLMK